MKDDVEAAFVVRVIAGKVNAVGRTRFGRVKTIEVGLATACVTRPVKNEGALDAPPKGEYPMVS
jgi:hypothetical protein